MARARPGASSREKLAGRQHQPDLREACWPWGALLQPVALWPPLARLACELDERLSRGPAVLGQGDDDWVLDIREIQT